MPNVRQRTMARRPGRASAAVLAMLVWTAAAQAADCPRKGTLGTSRVMTVDPAIWPRIGRRDFAQTLPLGDHEVVLTFDDGPWPATTPRVLRTLARECVRATFFLIGKPASEFPWHRAGRPRPRDTRSGITPGCISACGGCPMRTRSRKSTRAFRRSRWRNMASRPRRRRRRSSAFPASNRRRPPSISCSRAASACSRPICWPTTGSG